jgi:hypothetical protein
MVAGVGLFVAQGGRRASLGWRAAATVRVQPANKKIKGCLLNSPSKEAISRCQAQSARAAHFLVIDRIVMR